MSHFCRAIARKVLTLLQVQTETEDLDLWGAVQMPLAFVHDSPIKVRWKDLCVSMRKALLFHFLSSSLKAGDSWWWQLLDIGTVETSRELGSSPQALLVRLNTNKQVNKYVEWQHIHSHYKNTFHLTVNNKQLEKLAESKGDMTMKCCIQ